MSVAPYANSNFAMVKFDQLSAILPSSFHLTRSRALSGSREISTSLHDWRTRKSAG